MWLKLWSPVWQLCWLVLVTTPPPPPPLPPPSPAPDVKTVCGSHLTQLIIVSQIITHSCVESARSWSWTAAADWWNAADGIFHSSELNMKTNTSKWKSVLQDLGVPTLFFVLVGNPIAAQLQLVPNYSTDRYFFCIVPSFLQLSLTVVLRRVKNPPSLHLFVQH